MTVGICCGAETVSASTIPSSGPLYTPNALHGPRLPGGEAQVDRRTKGGGRQVTSKVLTCHLRRHYWVCWPWNRPVDTT
ncbi:hypothetical protein GCM10018793_43050 [Streptomyces sulfonofaciens]|uniref:Uncharacterized protein n=1 Tax=Streptomyces sulfonofaciens TaxID=68272 RepID=A0A919GDT1_9ACTN|nr:hypothetical protein GCM10018793_43050 [Streptomyces sulfonofaciens]